MNQKLIFLKLALIELVKKTVNLKKEHTKLQLFYSITFSKLTLYPFLLSTANGEASRKIMFKDVFTDFEADDYGLIETDIKRELSILLTTEEDFFKPYFDTIRLKDNDFDKIILFPAIDKIDAADIKTLWEEENIDKDFYDNKDEVNYELIKHLVKNILKKHPNFLLYSIEDLSFIIRNYYRSWKVQKVWNDNTDFDKKGEALETDYRYKIFTGEKHIMST